MSDRKVRQCNPWLGPDGTYNHRHDCAEVPDDPRHVRESAELTASTDSIRDEEAQGVKQETQRDVFEALVLEWAVNRTLDPTERELPERIMQERYKWLQRFDTAATMSWTKPSDRLPEKGQEVLVLIDWRDHSPLPQSDMLYSIALFDEYVGEDGVELRWYTDDHGALLTDDVAYWWPLPPRPAEVLK